MDSAPQAVRALLVDDEEDNRLLLRGRLRETPGWAVEVAEACDAAGALAALSDRLFDLAFVDFRLGAEDGLEVLARIRQLHPKVAVVMVSTWGSEKTAVEAMRRGAIDYMSRRDLEDADLGQLLCRALELQRLHTQNAELRQVNRMKDEFISSVSHELRTPLAVILGYARTLEDGEMGPLAPPQRKAVEAIRRRGEGLLEHLNRLLTFKEGEEGRARLELRPTDLSALLREVLAVERPELARRGLRLESSVPQDPLWVLGDSGKLGAVADGLLSNAVKFSRDGGRIVAALEPSEGRTCRLRISDEGRGIAPEDLPRLFEALPRGDAALTDTAHGLGLGLALARQVVEQHGGQIWLESPGPGRGATATVSLPLVEAGAPAAVVPAPSPPSGKRVLVVEDNEDVVEIIRLFLAHLEKQAIVDTTPRGVQALELLAAAAYDLLILDLMMPGMNGFEILERLKALPPGRRPPVLILSGHQEAARQAVRRGASAYLLKPFHREEFLAKVRELFPLLPARQS